MRRLRCCWEMLWKQNEINRGMFSLMILHLDPPHPTSVVEKSDELHLEGFVFGKKSTLSKRRCNKRAFSFYLTWPLHIARETSSSVDGCTLAAWPHLGWIGLCNCHLCCISYWDLQWAGYHTMKYAESTIFGPLSSENSKWSQCILRRKAPALPSGLHGAVL